MEADLQQAAAAAVCVLEGGGQARRAAAATWAIENTARTLTTTVGAGHSDDYAFL